MLLGAYGVVEEDEDGNRGPTDDEDGDSGPVEGYEGSLVNDDNG